MVIGAGGPGRGPTTDANTEAVSLLGGRELLSRLGIGRYDRWLDLPHALFGGGETVEERARHIGVGVICERPAEHSATPL
jgi:hypothetical protein